MGYSRLEYPYAGGSQDFPVNFALGYIDPIDVQVYVIGEVDGFGAQSYRPYTWVNAGTIRVTSALPNPCTVVVIRTVDKEQLELDLESTGAVTRVTLTRAFKQLMMNIHELLDGRADAFQGILFDVVEGLRDQALAYRDAALVNANAATAQADLALVRAGLAETARLASVVAKDAAAASQTAAAGSATAAAGSATTAAGAIAATQAARDLTLTYRDATLAYRDAAAASALAAAASATGASGDATTATTQAGIATTKAGEASASAEAAAAAAAGIDATRYVPLGTILWVPKTTAPTGTLKANGAAVSRTTYSALFGYIGTTFGVGDGSTTFNLPDLRGEFVRGLDDGRGVDTARALGSAQLDAFQGHWHNITASEGGQSGGSGAWTGAAGVAGGTIRADRVRGAVTDTGNGTPRIASETRPRNIAMLACIKF